MRAAPLDPVIDRRFRTIYESAPIGIVMLDPLGRVLQANPAFERLLGYTAEELRHLAASELIHPDDLAEGLWLFEELRAGRREQYSREARSYHRDGRLIWLRTTVAAVRDGAGQLRYTVSMDEDITERKQAEEALRERVRQAALGADIGVAVTERGSLREILQHCAEALVRHLDVAFARIWTLDDEEQLLELRASAGLHTHLDGAHARVPVGRYKIGLIAQERRPHLTNQVVDDPRVHDQDWARREGFVAFAGYPLLVEDRLVGVLAMFARHALAETTLQVLASVADRIALGIERKRAEEALRAGEAQYRTIIETTSEWIWEIDCDGRYTYCNPAVATLLGYRPEELIGRDSLDYLHEDDRRHIAALLPGLVAERRGWHGLVLRRRHQDGRYLYLESNAVPVLDARGALTGYRGADRDVTVRKQVEQALRASETLHRTVVDTAFDAIVTLDAAGLVRSFNRGAERLFGYAPSEVVGRPLTLLMPQRLRPTYTAVLRREAHANATGSPGRVMEAAGRRKDGAEFPLELSISRVGEGPQALLTTILRDITERKAFEAQLRHQAFHDPLTDLPNRALFLERLGHALARAGRRPETHAVLYVDLDRFKAVNDSLGHAAGDQLLVVVGGRLAGCLRPDDTVARLGGDEFAVLLEGLGGAADAIRVAERIIAACQAPVTLEGREVVVTPSVGIALNAPEYDRAEALLRAADAAMYRVKERGKAGYELFDPSMNARALERLDLEADLRRALERGQLRVHYQPQVELATGRVAGAEALARWEHPERGLMPPAEFIALAEETGLIRPLGRWVLEEACRQLRAWHERHPARPQPWLCVNLSVRQFQHPDVVDEVAAALRASGLPHDCLVLELTESVLIAEGEAAVATLRRLKDLGVRLALDDFGTGYSSLGYLSRFPIDIIKIDRSFVQQLWTQREAMAIVEATLLIARKLGKTVIAEGVETEQQRRFLSNLGCELGQGYLFARPLPPEALEARLSAPSPDAAPLSAG